MSEMSDFDREIELRQLLADADERIQPETCVRCSGNREEIVRLLAQLRAERLKVMDLRHRLECARVELADLETGLEIDL